MGGREEILPQDNTVTGLGRAGETRERLPLVAGGAHFLTHSPRPCSPLPVSSGVALNVVLHFIPEVLLVSQMMFRSFYIQWIIKIQQISKQRV